MARWAVTFEDATVHPGLRDQRHKEDHHAYLREHRDVIRLAGAVSDDAGNPFTGGLRLVEADNRESVAQLVEACTFYLSGVHQTYRLLWWGSPQGFDDWSFANAQGT